MNLSKKIELVNKTIHSRRGIVGIFKTTNGYDYIFIQSPNTEPKPKKLNDISVSEVRMAREPVKRQETHHPRIKGTRNYR